MLIFFFNDTATTEIYTLSLHDALPISGRDHRVADVARRDDPARRELRCRAAGVLERRAQVLATREHADRDVRTARRRERRARGDRKSTRLNSSHANISYAVFCLKKKK